MAERTVKVGSAGKIFSLTGWKVGWAVGAAARSPRRSPRRTSSSPSPPRPICRPRSPTASARTTAISTAMRARLRRRARPAARAALEAAGYRGAAGRGHLFPLVDLAASGIAADDVDLLRARGRARPASPRSRSRPSTPRSRSPTSSASASPSRPETLDAGIERLGQGAGAVRGLSGRNCTNHPRRGGETRPRPGPRRHARSRPGQEFDEANDENGERPVRKYLTSPPR